MRALVLATCWTLLFWANGCELIAGIDDRATVASASATGPGGAGAGAGGGAGTAGSGLGGTGACPTGTADCDGSPRTACDSLSSSNKHCGGCDKPCDGGCLDGSCQPLPTQQFEVWVRADDGITLVDEQVASWKNQAGPGGEIEQPTASRRPTMGTLTNAAATRPAVELDGRDDLLPIPNLVGFQQLVLVLVFAANSDAVGTLYEFPGLTGPEIELWHPQLLDNDLHYESGGLLVTAYSYLSTATIITVEHGGGGDVVVTTNGDPRLAQYASGAPSLNAAAWSGAVLANSLDAARPFQGLIGEFIVARELDPGQLGLVHAYLRAKYGIGD